MNRNKLQVGVLYSRLRVEEKWIFAALEARGISYQRIDDREIILDTNLPGDWRQFDVILASNLSYPLAASLFRTS